MRCQGTASPPEGVADHDVEGPEGSLDRLPGVAQAHVDAVARHVAELGLGDLVDLRIELEDGLPGVGMHRPDVAREREPATPDVEDVRRSPEPATERRRRVGEAAHVAELEIGRVAQVDGGVGESIEHEDADVGVGGVTLDGDAVVGAPCRTAMAAQGEPAGQQHSGYRHRRRSGSPAP